MFNSDTTPSAADSNPTAETQPYPTAYPFRLLQDETVIGTFPIARKSRPFGKLASYLFITDSRVIYSAEARSFASSSTRLKEYQVPTIQGIEVGRHRGLDALGVAVTIGVALNFIGWLIAAIWAGSASTGYGDAYYGGNPFTAFNWIPGVLATLSLIVGVITVGIMLRPRADISIVGPREARGIAQETDFPKLFLIILLFLVFGLFIALALIGWALIRELGVFKADDAQLFADSRNIDALSYEAGALIMDVQARGKLAGK